MRMSSFFDDVITLLVLCAFAAGCVATIRTDQQAIGWLGQDVRLPCDFSYPDVLALYWMNSNGVSKASFFKAEPNSFDDRFTLNDDFSIVIRDVKVSDEGRYSCRLELDSGKSFINHTELTIFASPSIPHIEQCADDQTGNEIHNRHSFCTVETSNTHPFNLECRVTGFRPNVTLEWTSSRIVKQPLGEPFQRKLPDGTSERVVTISVTAKLDEEQNYTCTVRGEATNGTDWSTTVMVLVPPAPTVVLPPDNGLSIGGQVVIAIFVILLIVCIILVTALGVLVGLRRRGKLQPKGEAVLNHVPFLRTLYLPVPDPEAVKLEQIKEELFSLREKLRDYKFKRPDGSKLQSAHIGLFGEMSAGKSSFMNSLEFAFTGEFRRSQVIGALESGGGKTISRTLLKLTDSISLFDNRGMSDFGVSNLDEIVAQLRGERGPDIQQIQPSEQEEIHCGVFIIKISAFNRGPGMLFIEAFARKLRQYNGYPPMIVITHAASLSDEERRAISEELSTNHDINENVWFFENYTKENSTEDEEKSIKMLQFLDAALQHCKLTVVHVDRRKNITPVKAKEKKKMQRVDPPSTSHETTKEEKGWCVIS